MRTIGHFCIFVGFFLAFASLLGLLLLAVVTVRSPLALLVIVPALFGFYGLYARGYRALLGGPVGQRRSLG
jgi:hypothetical protein